MISLCFEIIKSMPDVSFSILARKKIGLLGICDDFYATLPRPRLGSYIRIFLLIYES